MKMLMFDFRESEKEFFNTHDFPDIDITFINGPLNKDYKLSEEKCYETDVISVFISSNLTKEVLEKFKNLRIIATRSTGYNHIDIDYCIEHNITVFNVGEYGHTSVAQYTISLILALTRNLVPAYVDMQKNDIRHYKYEGNDLNNLTLGIIGCGAIGSVVAKIAHSFGMKVIINSFTKNSEVEKFAEFTSKDNLLKNSDIITLHLPLTSENYHILGEKEFDKMKQGVIIVNTARGELIDIVALYKNIISQKVKATGLDVLECEYLSNSSNNLIKDIDNSESDCITKALITERLLSMKNVIVTPHIAYNTKESITTLLETTFNNIRSYTKGERQNKVC